MTQRDITGKYDMKKILFLFMSIISIACAFATSNEKCHWTTKSDESSKIEEKHYGRTVRQYDDRNNYTHDECEDENGKRNKRTWEHGW